MKRAVLFFLLLSCGCRGVEETREYVGKIKSVHIAGQLMTIETDSAIFVTNDSFLSYKYGQDVYRVTRKDFGTRVYILVGEHRITIE